MQLVEAHARVESYREAQYRGFRRLGRIIAFVDPVGETVMDQFLVGRRTRPYNEWRPLVHEFLTTVAGLPDSIKLSWSQRAGCSCPCSPGFIVKHSDDTFMRPEENPWLDVWIFLDMEHNSYLTDVKELVQIRTGT